jgi:hypothetical protein
MKRIRNLFILLILAALIGPQTADAQLLKRAKERAQKRIEERLQRKADDAVDDAVDEAADGVEDAARSAVERRIDEASKPAELNLGPNASGPASAAHIRYVSSTTMDLGALGTVARLLGQDFGNLSQTVSLSGLRQRSDEGTTSTIIDLENDRMITLDHEKKQYSVLTFAEMAAKMDEAAAAMKDQANAEGAVSSQDAEAGSDAEADFTFDLSVDRTGNVETIHGSPSEQVLLAVRTEFEVEAEDDQEEKTSVRGVMYALVDTWTTKEIAGSETMEKFQLAMAQKMGEEVGKTDIGAAIGAIGQDPRLGASMEKASEEMQNLDGMPVRTTMHFILAPEGHQLDVQAALQPPADQSSGGMSGLAQMAESMEANGGEAGEISQQMTLLRITTQISDLQVDSIPDDFFDIPADYSQVDVF